MISMDDAAEAVRQLPRGSLIGIDGLPCSGKSSLVERIEARVDISCIYLDDFVRPERDWPSRNRLAFPFEYMRYDAFLAAVQALAAEGECSYHPYDWQTHSVMPEARTVTREQTVIVEGVSALHPELAPLYDLKVFVESDRATTLDASLARGVGAWEAEWRELFLPSADLYMAGDPAGRSDMLVAGRGVSSGTTE
jgi:uridine kinase